MGTVKKGTGKNGTEKRAQEKWAQEKKGTSEKLGKKVTKRKIVLICKLHLLPFNQHLNYLICIFCGCLLFKLLEK